MKSGSDQEGPSVYLSIIKEVKSARVAPSLVHFLLLHNKTPQTNSMKQQ